LAIALVAYSHRAVAQTTVHSFETGTDGWSGTVATSGIGATDGTQSLQVTVLSGFTYISDAFNKFTDWTTLLPTGDSISFDITLDAGSNPTGGATFLQTRVALNGDDPDGAGGIPNFQESNMSQPDLNIPLTPGTNTATFDLDFWTQPPTWTFQGFAIALNTDAPLLVYIDNVRVNPAVPEPTTLVVCALGLVGLSAVRMRRRK
jgi:hypothetical protein